MSDLNYQSASKELEEIVQKIQQDEISIDELASSIKRARILIEFCQNKLRAVKTELDALNED